MLREKAKQTAGNCGKPQQNRGESVQAWCYSPVIVTRYLTRRNLRQGGLIWFTVPGDTHHDREDMAAGSAMW